MAESVSQITAPGSQPKFKRKIVIIKKTLQTKYVALVFLSILVASALVAWHIHYNFQEIYALIDQADHGKLKFIQNEILVKLLIFSVIIAVVSIYISHRFAGPVFRIERSCDIVAEGDLTYRAFLRKGDELNELKDKFNHMMDSVHNKVKRDQQTAHKVAQQLSSAKSPQELEEMKKELTQIVELQLKEVQERLSQKKIALEITAKAKEYLAEAGYDPIYGARPLKRVIQSEVLDPLAMMLLEKEIEDQTLTVDSTKSGLNIKVK